LVFRYAAASQNLCDACPLLAKNRHYTNCTTVKTVFPVGDEWNRLISTVADTMT
jgi:hypothetical protein